MKVRTFRKTLTSEIEKTIEIPDTGDFFVNVANECGWTEKRKAKYDNPLWFLSSFGYKKIEKIGE